jgi:hypothetical protein
MNDTKPWWQQGWPWLLIALPGSMVVIAFGLLAVALGNHDELVTPHPYETGLAVGSVVKMAQRAQALNLSAQIALTGNAVTVQLQPITADAELKLKLEHPFSAARDRVLTLERIAPGVYQAQADLDPVLYSVQLETRQWSLSGRWKPGDQADLKPGVALPPGAAPQDD